MSSKKNLTPSERIQANQREKLRGFMKGILNLFGKYINSPFQIPNLLQQLTQTKEFNSFTERLGLRFVNEVKVWNERTFKEYMKTSYAEKSRNIFLGVSRDDEFQKFIQKQAEERANLFKRIPVNLANHVTTNISKWSVQGMTSKEVSYKLREYIPNLLESQVKTIARTETSKTLIGLTSYKSIKNNIPCYQWKASGGYSGDGRTRNSHRHMSDVIVFWNDPPAPEDLFPTGYRNTLGHYHAGCCPNCRCSAMPVVFVEDLKFPVRVYRNGQITKMNKIDFLNLYNGKIQELKAEKQPQQQKKVENISQQEITIQQQKTVTQKVQQQLANKTIQEETTEYLKNNYKEIENVFLDDLDYDTVKPIKYCIDKINNEIIKATGKKIKITTIKTIASNEKFFNLLIKENYIKDRLNIAKQKYKDTNNNQEPSKEWETEKKKEIEDTLKNNLDLIPNTKTLAFYASKNFLEKTLKLTDPKLIEKYQGLYFVKDKINGYENRQHNENLKESPPNCYNVKGVINHEYGHILDSFLNLSLNLFDSPPYYDNGIRNLYTKDFQEYDKVLTLMRKAKLSYEDALLTIKQTDPKSDFLSTYAFSKHEFGELDPRRYREFIAEAISEVLTVGYEHARKTAKDVWDIVVKELQNKK